MVQLPIAIRAATVNVIRVEKPYTAGLGDMGMFSDTNVSAFRLVKGLQRLHVV